MGTLQAGVLGLLQGLTEFLPISSSAHLILVPVLVGWPDQGLTFDVAVHVGTLAAVLAYFRRELFRMSCSSLIAVRTRALDADARLAGLVVVGTLPVVATGLLLDAAGSFDVMETAALFRGAALIATTTTGFALMLWWADHRGTHTRTEQSFNWRDALVVGAAQVLALIPGTSRSGITITAALALGFERKAAARFSFLLSIPVIAAAALRSTAGVVEASETPDWAALALGMAISALSAWLTIHFFLKLMDRVGLLPFVLYRLVLGALLFVFVV